MKLLRVEEQLHGNLSHGSRKGTSVESSRGKLGWRGREKKQLSGVAGSLSVAERHTIGEVMGYWFVLVVIAAVSPIGGVTSCKWRKDG